MRFSTPVEEVKVCALLVISHETARPVRSMQYVQAYAGACVIVALRVLTADPQESSQWNCMM